MSTAGTLKVTTPSDREIVITRVFDAYTKPELLKKWLLGPPGWTMVVCEIDPKVGGAYRYQWRGPDGAEMGMRGVYREIVPPERIVATETFDQSWYPGDALDTMVLVEKDGKTTLTLTVVYESREARDIAIKSNMEQGLTAGYNKLAEVLASALAGEGK